VNELDAANGTLGWGCWAVAVAGGRWQVAGGNDDSDDQDEY
jgi:hypothetical protein